MSINLVLPFITTAVMVVFSVFVLERYRTGRRLYSLFWGIGLAMFTIASFAEAYLTLGWNRWMFFAWYFFGAILTAAWIGQGTIYLLFRRKRIHLLTALLIAASLVALMLMLQVMPQLDAAQFTPAEPISEQYGDIMPRSAIRYSTIPFNIYGTLTIVGGAIWSAYLFWRKRVLPNRVIGNVLIAAGALTIASASTLTRFGEGQFLYLGELLAATLMFAGFRVSARPSDQYLVSSKQYSVSSN